MVLRKKHKSSHTPPLKNWINLTTENRKGKKTKCAIILKRTIPFSIYYSIHFYEPFTSFLPLVFI
uniref:Ovule protein n=1 Tax=Heterorhabditis bacteriophora TaxID=37862 RepID=A0A1I7W825_HETBA